MLTIDEVRKEFSGYLSSRVTEKKSLDAAFMHIATYCFTKGIDSILGETESLLKEANKPVGTGLSYKDGIEAGRIFSARALLIKMGLNDKVDVAGKQE